MECDAVIVGSGPSGSAAAYFLASKGFNVICIDRLDGEGFSRYHSICGECISEKGARTIGLQPQEIRNRVSEFRIDWPGGKITRVKVKGFIIDRVKVIARLRRESEQNGAKYITSAVSSVEKTENGYRTVLRSGEEILSQYVIGADGAYSTVRKCLFECRPQKILQVDMRVLDKPPEFPETIRFGLKGKGNYYCWDFPYGNGSSVGAVRGHLDCDEGIRGARGIPIGWPDGIVSGNAVLIGDAGGMVNPLSFGGLRIAFETAKRAADAIASGNPEAYESWWRKSPLSDRRFMELSEKFAAYEDHDYEYFASHLGGGFWSGGAISVITRPRMAWMYFGCLMVIRNGW